MKKLGIILILMLVPPCQIMAATDNLAMPGLGNLLPNPARDDIMKIKVKFFASYKEAVGRDELDLDMEDESDVSQLLEAVKAIHPAIGELIEPLIVSVNKEYADFDKVLKEGDEVALLPPVSGG